MYVNVVGGTELELDLVAAEARPQSEHDVDQNLRRRVALDFTAGFGGKSQNCGRSGRRRHFAQATRQL